MSIFQVIGLVVLAALVLLTVSGRSRRRFGRRESLLWLALWLAAAVALARPELTLAAARLAGIGRGADLVFYTAILAGGAGFFVVYLRLRRIESQLTTLTRHIALQQTHTQDPDSPAPGHDRHHEPRARSSRIEATSGETSPSAK